MWVTNPLVQTITTHPVGNMVPIIALRVECSPRLPMPGWPAASFVTWTENEKGDKLNMPFTAQVSFKQPWILFNIPYIPPGTQQIVVKAKGFPLTHHVLQVRAEQGLKEPATDPRPADWQAPESPAEKIEKGIPKLGQNMAISGIIVLLAVVIVIIVIARTLPKVLESPVGQAATKAALL